MSKKLVNNPERCVDEALQGFVALNPGVQLLQSQRIVVRSDIDDVKKRGQVTLLSGGGSGHEPAHMGYVGCGMLSAAVAGSVFTSPPPAHILTAIETIAHDNPAGCLIIIKNYTGDRLNFGLATERAKNLGLRLETITICDDCAFMSRDKTAGRRGLAGTVFVHKIAGALAEEGKSLEEILTFVEQASKRMGTIGLSLSPCSVPGSGPSFTLADDEMELGLGIHGEAGVKRMKILPAKEAVSEMLNHMIDPKSSTRLDIIKGDHVALLVNNLGGTSQLEMNIVAREAIAYLESHGVDVDRAYCGSYVTSLEMAGVSLTVLHSDDTIKRCLDAPTNAPGWIRPLLPTGSTDRVTPSLRPVQQLATLEKALGAKCSPVQSSLLKQSLVGACEVLIKNEVYLNQLDLQCGDGDCGSTHKRGAEAILAKLNDYESGDVTDHCLSITHPHLLMMQLSDIVSQSMGGTSGALYSLFFSSCAGPLLNKPDSDTWIAAFKAGIDTVSRYGGAQPGDRTMLDAMCPAYRTMVDNFNLEPMAALLKSVETSETGAASTTGMSARAGRASYVHGDHLSQPDPGAVAFSLWFRAVYEAMKET